jgi:hypothetical protein
MTCIPLSPSWRDQFVEDSLLRTERFGHMEDGIIDASNRLAAVETGKASDVTGWVSAADYAPRQWRNCH